MKIFLLLNVFIISMAYAQFPAGTEVSNTSPISGETYEHVKVGETYLKKRLGKNYYYRYITLYNKTNYQEEILSVPTFEEYCHEAGDRVASWGFSKSYSRSIQTGVSFELLGFGIDLGGELSQSFEVSVTRWIQAISGVNALHIPMMSFQSLEGETYLQRYYPHNMQVDDISLRNDYFHIDRLNPVFKIKREIISSCNQ